MAKDTEDQLGTAIHTAMQVWKCGSWCAHKIPLLKPVFREIRRRRDATVYQQLHEDVLQSMRRLAIAMDGPKVGSSTLLAMANDLCTNFRGAMGPRLTLNEHDLHCCWKMLRPGKNGSPLLQTFGKSRPFDEGRPVRDVHVLDSSRSTIYAALTGGSDGEINWRIFPVFCCNDLPKYGDRFRTGRDLWQKYYRATIVFPLRYVRDFDAEDYDTIGFIAFNTRKIGAFADMPEIFEYQNRVQDYRNALCGSPTYHLGAMFADTLAAYLHGVYNGRPKTHGWSHANEQTIEANTSSGDRPNLANGSNEEAGIS